MNAFHDRMSRVAAAMLLSLSLAACTGSTGGLGDDAGSGPASSSGGATSGGSEGVNPQADCPSGELCLKAPSAGFQVQTVGDQIQPGEDVEFCEVVELPGDPDETYYVSEFELAMTTFSHHLIVVAALPGSATEANIKAGDKKKCFTPDAFGGEISSVTGSQKPYHRESFPDGVGKVFHGGQKLIFDYHYFNASKAPVQARGAVNFHLVEASHVQRIAHSFGFYNFDIKTPPQTTKSFEATCGFTRDVLVQKLTRHTHQWGRDFSVAFAGGAKDGSHIWTSPDYEVTEFVFDEPVLMSKGTGFTFTCEFENTTAETLKFGITAADEMCILFGTWFTPVVGDDSAAEQRCDAY